MVILVPLLSMVAWLTLEVMILLNPSNTIALGFTGVIEVVFLIISAISAFVLPYITSRQKEKTHFFISFFAGLIILILMSGFSARGLHRDFDTYGTQILLLHYTLLIFKLDGLGLVRRKRVVYGTFTIATIVLFILWISWLMMMAYAIVTRVEPRWIEATAYNLVNGFIGFLMLASAGFLWERAKRQFQFKNSKLYIDERDISSTLSPQECDIIISFLYAENMTLNCHSLYERLSKKQSEVPICEKCLDENWKVTSCSTYKNYKNRINAIKKYIELLQIGTIVPVSESTRDIKTSGWRLRLFDDVRFHLSNRDKHKPLG